MVLPRIIIAIVAAALIGTSIPAGRAQADAQVRSCAIRPRLLVTMPDQRGYAVVLRAPAAGNDDVHVRLYSESATYDVALNGVRFRAKGTTFESTARFIALPAADSVMAVDVEIAGRNVQACGLPYVFSDAVVRRQDPNYEPSAPQVAEATLYVHAYERGIDTIPATVSDARAVSCEESFALPHILRHVAPSISSAIAARRAHVEIAVALDAGGSVTGGRILQSTGDDYRDHVALAAAERSSYSPAILRCVAVPSTIVYRADFPNSGITSAGRDWMFGSSGADAGSLGRTDNGYRTPDSGYPHVPGALPDPPQLQSSPK
jgi:TonB family protein